MPCPSFYKQYTSGTLPEHIKERSKTFQTDYIYCYDFINSSAFGWMIQTKWIIHGPSFWNAEQQYIKDHLPKLMKLFYGLEDK